MRPWIPAFVAVLAIVSCSGPTEPARGTPGMTIHVVRTTDTIGGTGSVVVTLRDEDGLAIPEPFLWFQSPPVGPDEQYMLHVGLSSFGGRAAVHGNETGNVSVAVTAGTIAGDAPLRIWNDQFDTVIRLPVRRGRSVSMRLEPEVPAVHPGHSRRIHAVQLDRGGNPDTVGATFTAQGDGYALSGDGSVTGLEVGADSLRVWADGFEVRTVVSVVPEGRLSTFIETGPYRWELRTIDLDGSDERVLHRRPFDALVQPSFPVFSADGGTVLFRSENGFHLLEPGASERTIAWNPTRPHRTAHAHALPGTGRFVVALRDGSTRLALLGPDSAALELVPEAWEGAPDPEGRRLVVRGPDGLLVHDLVTGERTALGIDGTRPSWSPGGSWIAFEDRGWIGVIRPDGSARSGPFPAPRFHSWVWVAGERWLAVLDAGSFVRGRNPFLLDVVTGEVIPLTPWPGAAGMGAGEPS